MDWWALVMTIPTANGTTRTRIWRALKSLGAGTLRDGLYLLPARPELRSALQNIAVDAQASGGTAQIVRMTSEGERQERAHMALFDRREAYGDLLARIGVARRALKGDSEALAMRTLRRLQKSLEDVQATDFFPGVPAERARAALERLARLTAEHYSPGEPTMASGAPEPLDAANYQRRTWATRRRPGIDRLASAWLIRRFIDPAARFLWLDRPADIPAKALGFDFDGAMFTHRGERVTFEVLLASFDLERDEALAHLGRVVHFLDVGGEEPAEAAGVRALVEGLRSLHFDDDLLCRSAIAAFDALHAGVGRQGGGDG